jgi:hypothetical protein
MDEYKLMNCSGAEVAIMQHMEKIISASDAKELAAHVLECERCREYYLAFDETMEYAASAEAKWYEAPANFSAAVMAKVNAFVSPKPAVEAIRRKGRLTLYILWGISAVLFGVALFFAFNPELFTNLANSYQLFSIIESALTNIRAIIGQITESAMRNTSFVESGFGIAALLFTLLLGALLFVLHKEQEETEI